MSTCYVFTIEYSSRTFTTPIVLYKPNHTSFYRSWTDIPLSILTGLNYDFGVRVE